MRIFGMGVPELLIILAVILLIFGPKNLPKLGSAIGKTVKGLREGMGAGKKEAEEASSDAVEVEQIVEDDEPQLAGAAVGADVSGAPKRRVVRKVSTK